MTRFKQAAWLLALVATAALAYTFGPFTMGMGSWDDPTFARAAAKFADIQHIPTLATNGTLRYMQPYDSIRFKYIDGIRQFSLSPIGAVCSQGGTGCTGQFCVYGGACQWPMNSFPLEQGRWVGAYDKGGVDRLDVGSCYPGINSGFVQTGYWGSAAEFDNGVTTIIGFFVDTGVVSTQSFIMRCK